MATLSSQPRRNPIIRMIVVSVSIALHIGLAVYLYRQIPPSSKIANPVLEIVKMP